MATAIAYMKCRNYGTDFHAHRLHGEGFSPFYPFTVIDHARMGAPIFPPRPRAGFSASACLFLKPETGIANRDSLGNSNLIELGKLH